MVRKVSLALALFAGASLAGALRLDEAGSSLERPKHELGHKREKSSAKREKSSAKHEKKGDKKSKVTFKQKLKNFFQDETTTPKPTWYGLPVYYEGHLPSNYFNMSHMEKQDYYFRIERWHEFVEEVKAKNKCRSPRPGEKIVYFVQHGDAVPKEEDAPVWELGVAQSKNVRWDPMIGQALSNDPKQRAQVIMMSPARKAMQSAVIAFADIMPDAKWEIDTDLRGMGMVEGTLVPALGSGALYNLSSIAAYTQPATMLLSQYRDLPHSWEKATKPHKDRMFDFADHLLERPEERFIIVSHGRMIHQANVSKTHPGEVLPSALLPDKTWRKLSPPDCWPKTA